MIHKTLFDKGTKEGDEVGDKETRNVIVSMDNRD